MRASRSVIDEPTGENRLQVAVYRWQVALQRKLGNEFAVVIQDSSLANVHSIRRVFLHGTQGLVETGSAEYLPRLNRYPHRRSCLLNIFQLTYIGRNRWIVENRNTAQFTVDFPEQLQSLTA